MLDENRQPTPEERDAIAAYMGWGSFGQELFQGSWAKPVYRDGWKDENDWLREHLGEEAWKSAQNSIINAHYTDPPTVETLWGMADRMGFIGGRVLEPSMGIGNFFALMPRHVMASSELTGIELDKLTGGMARFLYPDANIQIKGYEQSQTADDFYDLVIGNWPFAAQGPSDRRYNKYAPSLHDYFFLKALDQVRPGGLVMGITSAGTMDKQGRNVRLALAKQGHLVAAYRLPTGAFQDYAGTKVVTDILVFQKKGEGVPNGIPAEEWLEADHVLGQRVDGSEVKVNRYWQKHPANVLGDMTVGRGTTQGRDGMIVNRPEDFERLLQKLPKLVPDNIMTRRESLGNVRYINNTVKDREGAVVVKDGGLYVVQGERLAALADLKNYRVKSAAETEKREAQVTALVAMREAYDGLIQAERLGVAPEVARAALNDRYQAFVREHGPLTESKGLKILKDVGDPHFPALAALETRLADGRYEPAAILSRPTMRTKAKPKNPSVRDAFVVMRNESALVDLARVAELAQTTEEAVAAELLGAGAIFRTPAGTYEVRDMYLSGNVRRKLREAIEAQDAGQDMAANIEALKAVVPPDVPYFSIEAKLGASWVPTDYYRQFVADLVGVSGKEVDEIVIRSMPTGWKVSLPTWINQRPEATNLHGVPFHPFSGLVQAAMNNTTITIRVPDKDGNMVVDEARSKAATEKAMGLREKFGEWVWQDAARRIELERAYNEIMNAVAEPAFDGSFLTFEGMVLTKGQGEFNLRSHQQDAIWRGIANGRGIYAHEVGTGKTYTMGGIAVESRRYGIARKPVIFAHNANSASVAAEIQEMYPAAKVLYVDNLSGDNVQTTLRRIANDEWDAVVVPHSLIDHFALSEQTLNALAEDDIAALEEEAMDAAQEDNADLTVSMMDDEEAMKKVRSSTAKQLVKARNAIKKKVADMALRASKEGAITFEDTGIDMILVDEAHEFKKPPLATRMKLKGLNAGTSDKSISLRFLTDYTRSLNGGRGVHIFTGTPITNTLNEIYNMMRYVMDEDMARDGVKAWDSWFNTFADQTTDVELTATGEYEPVSRLAAFVNVAELRRMAGQFMHIVFADEMPEFKPRTTASGKTNFDKDLTEAEQDELLNGRSDNPLGRPYKKIVNETAEMNPVQRSILMELIGFARDFKAATKKERREIMLSGDPRSPILVETAAANAGFDARLYDMAAPDDPNSKVNRAVRNVLFHYREHPLATQVIFMERGYNDFSTQRGQKVPKFNIAKDFVNKLVAGGVPREQIAIVTGETSKEKRKAIADAMNRAEIRVVIGSSATLGVGVNMQRNLRAMHHLDAPWMPGLLEQRNGRGQRQGNQWNTVLEYRYLTEGLDGRRWQVLAVKQKFITAFLKADASVRVIEGDAVSLDEGEGMDDLAESLSSASGDPRILVREKLKADVRKLETRERMHSQGIEDAQQQIKRLAREIEDLTQEREALQADAEAYAQARERGFVMEVKGKTYIDRKDAQAAFDDALKKLKMDSDDNHIATLFGFSVRVDVRDGGTQRAYRVRLTRGTVYRSHGWRRENEGRYETKAVYWAEPSLASMKAVLRGLARKVETKADEARESGNAIVKFQQAAETPFGQAAALKKKRDLLNQVDRDLANYPAAAPAWLRNGAPTGTDVFLKNEEAPTVYNVPSYGWARPFKRGDNPLDADLVEGYGWLVPASQEDVRPTEERRTATVQSHRWGTDNWWVLVDDGEKVRPVAYTDLRDENNLPVFEERPFERPPMVEAASKGGQASAASSSQEKPRASTPKGVKVGDPVSMGDQDWTVARLIAPENPAERDRESRWSLEIEPVGGGERQTVAADAVTLRGDGGTRFSRSRFSWEASQGGSTPESVRAELSKQFGPVIQKLENSDQLRILESWQALRGIASNARPGDKALFDGERVYLVAPNIRPGYAAGVFLHDSGVHKSLMEWIGQDKFSELVGDFQRLLKAGDATAVKAEEQVQRLLRDGAMDPAHADEERIAYLVEYVTNATQDAARSLGGRVRMFVTKVIAALRAALYASTFGKWLQANGFELSAQDFAALARAAVRREADGMREAALASQINQAPMFYSALTRAVEGMRQPKAPPGQWAAMIDKAPGVKAEEVEWSGVKEWLAEQQGPVTRDALVEYLRGQEVQVREVTKAGKDTTGWRIKSEPPNWAEADETFWIIPPWEKAAGIGPFDSEAEARADMERRIPDTRKYAQYQVSGGDRGSYRELLLTLPVSQESKQALKNWRAERFGEDTGADYEGWNVRADMPDGSVFRSEIAAEDAATAEEAIDIAKSVAREHELTDKAGEVYRSSHWDEPNVLAHVRFNERTDAEGRRVLLVEEVQSDWHQDGRKKGYGPVDVERNKGPFPAILPWRVNDRTFRDRGEAEAYAESVRGEVVPNAPFKQSWPLLAMKRMIRWAAEEGYDRIAWTPGAVQAARYNLSKQIGRIELDDNNSGGVGLPRLEGIFKGGLLKAYDHGGREVLFKHIASEGEIADVIGQELAAKLIAAKPVAARSAGTGVRRRSLSGLQLEVGGEGMKGFYDKILPTEVGRYVKKWGAKVVPVAIGQPVRNELDLSSLGEDAPIDNSTRFQVQVQAQGIDITPAMKLSVLEEGQPLFARPDLVNPREYMHFKDVTKRVPELQEAANALDRGEITAEQYDALVNQYKPVTAYRNLPKPASVADMQKALSSDKTEKIGQAMATLQAGEQVGLRLDIPAYANHGTWVVTVHTPRSTGMAGKPIGYESVAAITGVKFGINEKAGLNIAKGKGKATIATMEGQWKPVTPEQAIKQGRAHLNDAAWVQVGMDPERHAYFYDRATMEPVVAADEVLQIGGLVFAKNPVYGAKSEFRYSRGDDPEAEADNLLDSGAAPRIEQNLKDILLTNPAQNGKTWLKGLRPLALPLLGRRQIVDVYGDDAPALREYDRLVQAYGSDSNKTQTEADRLAQAWGRLSQVAADRLADIMHFSTLHQVNAAWATYKPKWTVETATKAFAEEYAAVSKEKRRLETLVRSTQGNVKGEIWELLEVERKNLAKLSKPWSERSFIKRKMKEEARRAANYQQVRARFVKLPQAAQDIYTQAAGMYDAHWQAVEQALVDRIERSDAVEAEKRRIIDKLRLTFRQRLPEVYFPLHRAGDYVVVVKNPDGTNVSVLFAESALAADRLHREMVARYQGTDKTVLPVAKKKERSAQDMVSGRFVSDVLNLIGDAGGGPKYEALREQVMQLYMESLPDLSWAKHEMRRKKVPGYSTDARRAFAAHMFHGAAHLARIRYADQLEKALDTAQTQVDERWRDSAFQAEHPEFDAARAQEVMNEMKKRHDLLMNPPNTPLANFLTSAGFVWFMGLSPASAIINLSQTPLVAFPVLGARFGFREAAKGLMVASKDVTEALSGGGWLKDENAILARLGQVLAPDELAVIRRGIEEGHLTVTLAHELAGVAQGAEQKPATRKITRAASYLFHTAELFNRVSTVLAAYRLARGQVDGRTGYDPQAYDKAIALNYESHFDYAAGNRPRAMQGPVARVILLFKQYAQNMIWLMGKSAYEGLIADPQFLPGADKLARQKEARRTIAGLMVMHGLAAGAFGLPLVGMLLTMASMFGSDDDEPWDAEVALRNALADMFGPDVAEAMVHGVPRLLPGHGPDIASRVGLNHLLLPDVQEGLEGDKWYQAAAVAALGPVPGIGLNIAKGAQTMSEGQWLRGLEEMLPKMLRDAVKTGRYVAEGVKDKTGVQILDDTDFLEDVAQAAGFAPARVLEAYESRGAVYNQKRRLDQRREELIADWARARMGGGGVTQAYAAVLAWNQVHPERAIKGDTLQRSLKARLNRVNRADAGVYLPKGQGQLREEGRFFRDW